MGEPVKNQHILHRFLYAWAGLRASWRSEKSFRAHIAVFLFIVCLLLVMRPPAVWWAFLLFASGGMMAVELINTAVEKLTDHLHPDRHEALAVVKDTLAAAVLVMCSAAVCVFVAFLCAGK